MVDMSNILTLTGNNIELLKSYPDNYFDSVVTDAPYGLGKEPDPIKLLQDWIDHGYHEIKGKGFMGNEWDAFVPQPILWKEVFRVLKPGGYLLCFFGTRTYDWGSLAIRLAGFEIRDMITYHYGSGFPKSLNIKKSIDERCCKCNEMADEPESELPMRIVSEDDLSKTICNKKANSYLLQSELSKQSEHNAVQGKKSCKSDENGNESSLERGCDGFQQKGKLSKYKVSSSSRMDETNGEEGWLYNGASNGNGKNSKEVINENRGGASRRPQSVKQQNIESSSISEQFISQEMGTWKNCDRCFKPMVPDGFGTALKPATEPICVARKPLEGTVAENYLKYGTGGINIDGSRIETDEIITNHSRGSESAKSKGKYGDSEAQETHQTKGQQKGRFPANVIFDEFTADILDKQTGILKSGAMTKSYEYQNNGYSLGKPTGATKSIHEANEGGASRFFYCAKASKSERNAGLEDFEEKTSGSYNFRNPSATGRSEDAESVVNMGGLTKPKQNFHPTVKPIALMRYLLKLVTPKGGKSLDLFAGSGTTGCASCFEDIGEMVLMERKKEYIPIIDARVKHWTIVAEEEIKEQIKQEKIKELMNNQLDLF